MDPRIEKVIKLPLYQRLLILFAFLALIGALFFYLMYMPKQEELAKLQKKHKSVQAKLQEDKRIANNLPKFKSEYEKMKVQLDKALTELPNQREIPSLLTSITSLAKDNGLDVLRFKPGKEAPKGFYAEVPVELKLVGSYHQIALFADDIGKLSRIVNINNLSLSNPKNQGGRTVLTVDCLATTFRFVEQAPDDKKKKKKKKKR